MTDSENFKTFLIGCSKFTSEYYLDENNIMIYKAGLCLRDGQLFVTICSRCFLFLSKNTVPKFSPANNAWIGEIPLELQGLTIPEEKLISVYRHNSCIVKLQSPFHSSETAQTALRGNCITFLQNMQNIVETLPLALNDLCETIKVIFVGSHPPKRIELKRVLTVRKKKVFEALCWLKKFNKIYQNVKINMENVNKLPDDDIPDTLLATLEQRIGDEMSCERTGYVPDPLSHVSDLTESDIVPVSSR